MKKKIKILTTFLIVIMLSFFLFSCKGNKELKIGNADFENAVESKTADNEKLIKISSWLAHYDKDDADIEFLRKENGDFPSYKSENDLGKRTLCIKTKKYEADNNTVNLSQKISFKRGRYKISADMALPKDIAKDKNELLGAYIGFFDDNDNFYGLNRKKVTQASETNTDIVWTNVVGYLECFIALDTELKIGVGGRGEAYFDNIKIEPVKAIPTGVVASQYGVSKGKYNNNGVSMTYVALFSLLMIGLLIGLFILFNKKSGKLQLANTESAKLDDENNDFESKWKSSIKYLLYALAATFFIRFFILYFADGMLGYKSLLSKFASELKTHGLSKIYEESDVIMAPGMMYIYWIIGAFCKAVKLDAGTSGFNMLVLLPQLIADILIVYLMFVIVLKYFNKNRAFAVAMSYAILPVFFISNAFFAYNASVLVLFTLLLVYCMLEKKYLHSIFVLSIGAYFDYNLFYALPIVAGYIILHIVKSDVKAIDAILSSVIALISLYLLSFPFDLTYIKGNQILHAFKMVIEYFKSFSAYTTNTYNMYAAFGYMNMKAALALKILCTIGFVVLFIYFGYIYYTRRNRLDLLIMLSATFMLAGTLGTKAIVELHMVGLALLLLYTFMSTDKRMFINFAISSTLITVNLMQLLSVSGYLTKHVNATTVQLANNDAAAITLSVFLVLNVFYFMFNVYRIIDREKITFFDEKLLDKNKIEDSFKNIKLKLKKESK